MLRCSGAGQFSPGDHIPSSKTLPPTHAGSIDTVSFLAYIEPNVAAEIEQLPDQSWLMSVLPAV